MDGNLRRGETEGKGRKSSGSVAGKIEMTGEKLRLDGIFHEGIRGLLESLSGRNGGSLKEWLLYKTRAPSRHLSLNTFRPLRSRNLQMPSAGLRTVRMERRRGTNGWLPRSRTVRGRNDRWHPDLNLKSQYYSN